MEIIDHKRKSFKKKNIRTSVQFNRPRTKKLERTPKYQKKLITFVKEKKHLKLFSHPITTEASMKKIQSSNTIILVFNPMANKKNIKFLMEKIYKTKVLKVNTLITSQGFKKAFIKLCPDHDALDVANKIGFI